MDELVKKLINDSKDATGARAVQVTLSNGTVIAGALLPSEWPDIYIVRTVLQNAHTRRADAIDMYVTRESMVSIAVPLEPSRVVAPEGPSIIPANSH